MKSIYTALTALALICVASNVNAEITTDVVAAVDTAAGIYDPGTGDIKVSANSVANWYIESTSSALTGAEPVGLPGGGGLLTNSDRRIGETGLAEFTYANKSLGPVARTGLACDGGNVTDLRIYYNAGLGQPVQNGPVACVPEPTGAILLGIGLLGLAIRRRS